LTGIDPVIVIAPIPNNTIAPPGNGRSIDPTIVAMKIANKFQDLYSIPSGTGVRKIAIPEPMTITHLKNKFRDEDNPPAF
jgi:hypothetical protein